MSEKKWYESRSENFKMIIDVYKWWFTWNLLPTSCQLYFPDFSVFRAINIRSQTEKICCFGTGNVCLKQNISFHTLETETFNVYWQ